MHEALEEKCEKLLSEVEVQKGLLEAESKKPKKASLDQSEVLSGRILIINPLKLELTAFQGKISNELKVSGTNDEKKLPRRSPSLFEQLDSINAPRSSKRSSRNSCNNALNFRTFAYASEEEKDNSRNIFDNFDFFQGPDSAPRQEKKTLEKSSLNGKRDKWDPYHVWKPGFLIDFRDFR